jgi:regulatory protein
MVTLDEAALATAALAPDASVAAAAAEDPVPDVERQAAGPDPRDVARQIVLRQLAMAPRSRAELMQKLAKRGCTAEVAGAVLDRMTQVGLVDDAAYAHMLVRTQQAGRGLARRALARELRTKGIEDELAQEALSSISDEDERDRARALVDKKLRAMHGLGMLVQTRRLAGMLARKGYSSSLAFAVIREAIADAPEYLPD